VIATLGLLTAWRPHYARSALFVGLVVFVAQFVAGFVDHMSDAVTGSFELIHLLVVVILIAMAAVAVSLARRATPHNEPRSPVLRAH
jgi:peptidoglycan/LPS O-acetylase OafA/YrhL